MSLRFPSIEELESIDNRGLFWDSQELSDLNSTIINTTKSLRAVSTEISKYERQRMELQLEYKRGMRQSIVHSTAKTETLKKQLAEIEHEDLEADLEVLEAILRELNRIAANLRLELDTLKTIGHNLRQEMRLI